MGGVCDVSIYFVEVNNPWVGEKNREVDRKYSNSFIMSYLIHFLYN